MALPSQASAPGIRLASRWQPLKGAAFGTTQPAALARVTVLVPAGCSFGALDQVMGSLIEEPFMAREPHADASLALLDRVLHWHTAVQRQMKVPVFGAYYVRRVTGEADEASAFQVAVPCHTVEATADSFRWVRTNADDLLGKDEIAAGELSRIRQAFGELLEGLKKHALGGLNNFHLVNAAHLLGIPTRQLLNDTYCFGQGIRSHWFNSTITDRTPALGANLSRSKARTARILRLHGVPVPDHRRARTEEQAIEIARELGFPVVVKPDDQEQGKGVEAGLGDEQAVLRAYRGAARHSKKILVEKHHDGEDYRLTVLGDRVVKILHRRAGGVTGDGRHTVSELVAFEQETPRFRRVLQQSGKVLLALDEEALGLLREHGLDAASIPREGQFVVLRRRNNISAGGIQTLIPVDEAHPDNLRLAVRATRAMHLDLCGVDMLVPDIARSWFDTGCVIIELNAQPQIGINTAPEVYQTIVRDLVPGNGRIPVDLVLCATAADLPGADEAARLVADAGANGLSMAAGVWVDGTRVAASCENGFAAAQVLLLAANVQRALVVMTARDVVENGLPADRFEKVAMRDRVGGSQEKPSLAMALRMLESHT
ncbi:MAG TPA: acetate--CoA ligase family protein [Ramlibacter sp.]|nr:acetate--CoA ligase family protein [Ramlibacter sp.]